MFFSRRKATSRGEGECWFQTSSILRKTDLVSQPIYGRGGSGQYVYKLISFFIKSLILENILVLSFCSLGPAGIVSDVLRL